jgi:hypothetical protein
MWNALILKEEQVKAALAELKKKGLVAHPYPISLPSAPGLAFPGIVFPEEAEEEILSALGLIGGPRVATTDPRLRLILTDKVTILGQRGDKQGALADVFRIYAPELGAYILAANPHGNASPPTDEEGVLHVRFFSTPIGPKRTVLDKAFGHALPPGMKDSLMPSGLGVPIRSEGAIIGELVGGTLYILFDLPHATPDEELPRNLLARVLEEVLEVRARSRGDGREESMEERYIRLALRRQRLRTVALLGRRAALKAKLSEARNAIFQAKSGLKEAERELALLGRGDPREAAEKEIRALKNHPHVQRIVIDGDYLSVFTDEIFLQHEGKTYNLGKYQIKVPLEGGGRLAILNLSPKMAGNEQVHHPLITGADGRTMCLGNFAPVISLIAERQWGLVAQLILQFLHHVNPAHEIYVRRLQSLWTPLEEPRPCTCQIGKKVKGGEQ